MIPAGLELAISWFVVRRLIHWATGPICQLYNNNVQWHTLFKYMYVNNCSNMIIVRWYTFVFLSLKRRKLHNLFMNLEKHKMKRGYIHIYIYIYSVKYQIMFLRMITTLINLSCRVELSFLAIYFPRQERSLRRRLHINKWLCHLLNYRLFYHTGEI